MREAFIKTLIKEARKNKKITLLTGDLGFTVFEEFRDQFPQRFINVGVAEQNMMAMAAGLALSGKIVFAYSMASFATLRPFEQIRNDISHHQLAVVIVASGAGLCYGYAGFTHHSLEDLNLMRGIPGMTILCPADPVETIWATRQAIKLKKPVYLRLGKKGEPVLNKKTAKSKLGKGRILRNGKDILLMATGNLVFNTWQAAKLLAQKNIQATVVSMSTLKPLDTGLIKDFSKKFSFLVTVEEHSIIGGLGSAVAEVLAEGKQKTRLIRLGIPDKFVTEIGSQVFLREKWGLTPDQIAENVRAILNSSHP